jgi:uncharacterized protein (UPF0332 family)
MTPEQEAVLYKARESLRAAQLLREEGFYDFSVSRAYYSMFYVAQAFLLGKGFTFSKHSAVISAFGREFVKSGTVAREFQTYLTDAEDSRKVGDYGVKHELTEDDAIKQLERARKFLELAGRLIGTPAED